MKWLLVALFAGHGVLHFLGAAEGLGLADVSALTEPVSRGAGVGWLVAGVGMLVTAVMLAGSSSLWWAAGLSSVLLSQAMILTSWSDARFGTAAKRGRAGRGDVWACDPGAVEPAGRVPAQGAGAS